MYPIKKGGICVTEKPKIPSGKRLIHRIVRKNIIRVVSVAETMPQTGIYVGKLPREKPRYAF